MSRKIGYFWEVCPFEDLLWFCGNLIESPFYFCSKGLSSKVSCSLVLLKLYYLSLQNVAFCILLFSAVCRFLPSVVSSVPFFVCWNWIVFWLCRLFVQFSLDVWFDLLLIRFSLDFCFLFPWFAYLSHMRILRYTILLQNFNTNGITEPASIVVRDLPSCLYYISAINYDKKYYHTNLSNNCVIKR